MFAKKICKNNHSNQNYSENHQREEKNHCLRSHNDLILFALKIATRHDMR